MKRRSRNKYYDSLEFKNRWFSEETTESIANDLDVYMKTVWAAAIRRGFPNKIIARKINPEEWPDATIFTPEND